MNTARDIDLALKLESAPKGVVYLSVSWQPDKGKEFGYRVIRRLDEEGFLAVGDTKGFDEMDPERIRRIMSQADGFLSLLPYRPEKPCKTSGFMLDELDAAIELGLPISLIYDARVDPSASDTPSGDAVSLKFPDGRTITIPKNVLVGHAGYDYGVPKSEELQLVNLADFLARATTPPATLQPYSFLICRLQPDFALPRAACVAAAEMAAGIPCLWIDSRGYATNVDDTADRARLLIRHAAFVVAEISLTDENPDFDSPSRAHEIGLAIAYRKKVFPVSHGPRRHPYHGLVARQLVWWDGESQLLNDLRDAIYAERGSVGRHVYNRELEKLGDGFKPHFASPHFDVDVAPAWRPPVAAEEGRTQSWIYAISFGVSAGCIALLLRQGLGYEDTLDLAAMFTGIVAFFFSSRLSKEVHLQLQRFAYLRWLIPLIAALLLTGTIIFLRPDSQKKQGNGGNAPTEATRTAAEDGQHPNHPDRQ
jgi:hypothetical protein